MSGIYIQRHIIGNIFLFNIYERFLIPVTFFLRFKRFVVFLNISTSMYWLTQI